LGDYEFGHHHFLVDGRGSDDPGSVWNYRISGPVYDPADNASDESRRGADWFEPWDDLLLPGTVNKRGRSNRLLDDI
jgi:hypothetical protein